jgi:hypothetical protein
MNAPVVKYFKSLRHAAINLQTSYYFLYNCYHKRHNNQFSKFFTVHEVDGDGVTMPYRKPRSNEHRGAKKKKNNKTTRTVFKKMVNTGKKAGHIKPSSTRTQSKTSSKSKSITSDNAKQKTNGSGLCSDTELWPSSSGWCNSWEQWAAEY